LVDQIRVDLRKLCEAADASFIEDRASVVDPIKQIITTDRTKRSLAYDAVSFDIGSETAGTDIPGATEFGIRVKPMESFVRFIDQLNDSTRTIVVGGGASGVELSLAIQARKRKRSEADPVTLVSLGALMGRTESHFTQKMNHIVTNKGVQLHLNFGTEEVHDGYVRLTSGLKLPFDYLLWMVGPKAPVLFEKSGLKVRDQGYLLVTPTLQSPAPNIFGAGDCVAIDGCSPLPKSGVYAVSEAKVLWENLIRFFALLPLRAYRPQSHYLSLISTGNQEAFFLYRNVVFHGKWCWKLKQGIDQRFISQYQ
jgi:NADH dehydrogenase FAD-containing subunit